jgi:hypothetical protein
MQIVKSFLVAAFLLTAVTLPAVAASSQFETLKTGYEDRAATIDKNHESHVASAGSKYEVSLNRAVEIAAKKKGDLDEVVALTNEVARFAGARTVPEEPPAGTHPAVVEMQKRYWAYMKAGDDNRNKQMAALLKQYISKLEVLRKSLTKKGKIKDAQEVDAEIKKMNYVLAEVAARLPKEKKADTPSTLKKGLVLHYGFDKDEGNKVTDKSGKKLDGVVHGAKWTSKGRCGGAYNFDGKDDMIEISRNPTISNCYTIAMWFTAGDQKRRLTGRQLISFNRRYQIGAMEFDGKIRFFSVAMNEASYGPHAMNLVSDGVKMKDDEWHHLCLVIEGRLPGKESKGTFYFDGNAAGSMSSRYGVNKGDLRLLIGALTNDPRKSPMAFWYGSIDEVMIYERPLSKKEVEELHKSRKGLSGTGLQKETR